MTHAASPPAHVCDRCPYDAGICLRDNWSLVEREEGGRALQFTCPFLDLAVDMPPAGLGTWHITDETSGSVIASGEALCTDTVIDRVADVFKRRNLFSPYDRTAIADAMGVATGYRSPDATDQAEAA